MAAIGMIEAMRIDVAIGLAGLHFHGKLRDLIYPRGGAVEPKALTTNYSPSRASMGNPTPPNLDPVSVVSAIALVVFGPVAAPYAGPYIVMLLGAFIGAMVALRMRSPDGGRTGAFGFVCILVVWSMAISIPVAWKFGDWAGQDWKWALFPVSLAAAAIGDKWVDIGKWFIGVLKAAFERMTRGGES